MNIYDWIATGIVLFSFITLGYLWYCNRKSRNIDLNAVYEMREVIAAYEKK